jgi:biopolymer transport protein ExbB
MWFLIFGKFLEIQAYKRRQMPLDECFQLIETDPSLVSKNWQCKLVQTFQDLRTHEPETDRKLLQDLAKQHLMKLQKHIPTIMFLATIAPLLGLLGTVTGMMTTFSVISRFGTGNAKALAAGISEALITTQSGLVVAIPGLFMGNFLNRRLQRFQARLDSFCLALSRKCELQDAESARVQEEEKHEKHSL